MLEGPGDDLLHQLAYQGAFLGKQLTDAVDGLLVVRLTVEKTGNTA